MSERKNYGIKNSRGKKKKVIKKTESDLIRFHDKRKREGNRREEK